METIQHLLQYILHIDEYLFAFVGNYGIWTYVVLFAIVFCETGLVVFPFLPGDSLLFAAGSIAASSAEVLNIQLLFLLLFAASIIGNKVNYIIGRIVGPRVFTSRHIRWFNKKHLERAHVFYEKHGGKTIILGRFLPIIRTFAPFVAGVSYMSVKQFTFFNILSAALWVGSLLSAGYFLGSLPFIKDNFSIVVYGVIAVSIVPVIIPFLYHKAGK